MTFTGAKETFHQMMMEYKAMQRYRNSVKREIMQEVQKYMTGKWDIINVNYTGKSRWGKGNRKVMTNDINNWYNAKVTDITINEFTYDPKTGEPRITLWITASGDNVQGDGVIPMEDVMFVPAYTSEEGKQFKRGY